MSEKLRVWMEDSWPALLAMSLLLCLLAAIATVGVAETQYRCQSYTTMTGQPARVVQGECWVQYGGEWMPFAKYTNTKPRGLK